MVNAKDEKRLYKDLAPFFPIITPPQDYLEEGEYFAQVIKNTSPIEAKTLLDLGSGGGNDDFALKKHFEITGVDVSDEMLKLARKLNPEVKYLKGDMRFICLKKEFDAVAIFDSINYMVTMDDLRAAFKTAFDHLKPGGILITVAEVTKDRFRQNWTRCLTNSKGSMEVTFTENYYDPDPKDTSYEATFVYLIREKGKLRVETDRHLCGVFELQTWIDLLQEIGFKVNQMEFNVSDPEAKNYPLFVCIKPQE